MVLWVPMEGRGSIYEETLVNRPYYFRGSSIDVSVYATSRNSYESTNCCTNESSNRLSHTTARPNEHKNNKSYKHTMANGIIR